jgi:hypothetical protein
MFTCDRWVLRIQVIRDLMLCIWISVRSYIPSEHWETNPATQCHIPGHLNHIQNHCGSRRSHSQCFFIKCNSILILVVLQGLTTNQWKWKGKKMESRHQDSFLRGLKGEKVHMCKGHPFGEFHLGSTIVLLFEAPKNFKFQLETGQRILVGEGISDCSIE